MCSSSEVAPAAWDADEAAGLVGQSGEHVDIAMHCRIGRAGVKAFAEEGTVHDVAGAHEHHRPGIDRTVDRHTAVESHGSAGDEHDGPRRRAECEWASQG